MRRKSRASVALISVNILAPRGRQLAGRASRYIIKRLIEPYPVQRWDEPALQKKVIGGHPDQHRPEIAATVRKIFSEMKTVGGRKASTRVVTIIKAHDG